MGLIAIDLETTGINPEHNRIIEIGAIRVETGEVFHTLVLLRFGAVKKVPFLTVAKVIRL